MAKHVTVRFAWHDDNWDGCVCQNPKDNIFCVGNYSLLSPRLQRRRLVNQESKHQNEELPLSLSESDFMPDDEYAYEGLYAPPCYWTINAFGDKDIELADSHPFEDTKRWGKRFANEVLPLPITLKRHSVITWCFKIGFGRNDKEQYVPIPILEKRTCDYLKSIEKTKSIAFFYANYSNPILGQEYNRKYLVLGAGLVNDRDEENDIKYFDIPKDLLTNIRSQWRMDNFPTQAWQFQLSLDPEKTVLLPYKEYYSWVQADELAEESRQEKLEELAVKVDDRTIIPHFKYVSMHLPHDKAIYILYQMLKSINQMKDHGLISLEKLGETESKTKNLLEIAWQERGEYPGFRNVAYLALVNDINDEDLQVLLPKIEHQIKYRFKGTASFLNEPLDKKELARMPSDVSYALQIIENTKELTKFLSLFNFTIIQFKKIRELIKYYGFNTVKNNPYLLLEHYVPDRAEEERREPDIDKNDFGIGLYQIDIALIPDRKYVTTWQSSYNAQSPERVRALISQILTETAKSDGRSFMYRKDILTKIEEYPLYYISSKLKIDDLLLSQYEMQGLFKEKFLIQENIEKNDAFYQLRNLERVEKNIEAFLEIVGKTKHAHNQDTINRLVQKDIDQFKEKIDPIERRVLYRNALSNGLFVLSGIAGSGKTQSVINLINEFWDEGKRSIHIFTPTGKANLVIRKRLRKLKLDNLEPELSVSTIHRFLYRYLREKGRLYRDYTRKKEIDSICEMIDDILSEGKWDLLDRLCLAMKNYKLKAKVVVIDEASMVDEVLLATLFAMIDPYEIEYLIFSGDERQLPPIGVGRPLVDITYHILDKWVNYETNLIQLKTNLRFDPCTRLAKLADLFAGEEEPTVSQIEEAITTPKDCLPDSSLSVRYFTDERSLEGIIKEVLREAGSLAFEDDSAFEAFAHMFEGADLTNHEVNLDRVQIITPRRIGSFGSEAINRKVIMQGNPIFGPQTKLICEENMYTNVDYKRILGLANGSIGYITERRAVHFNEIKELESIYGFDSLKPLRRDINTDVFGAMKIEKKINFGYSITVHKSQGSDFDHVILVLPDKSIFVTRELLYTAITRPKEKLHIVVNKKLEDELPKILQEAYFRSAVAGHDTLLFGHKTQYKRPFKLTLKDGSVVAFASKIEYMIGDILDKAGVYFEYECSDFLDKYHFLPDFKFKINGKFYYLEHLGNINIRYANRWNWKKDVYTRLGYIDNLITTSEKEDSSNVNSTIAQIISDVTCNKLRSTPASYSNHHYEL